MKLFAYLAVCQDAESLESAVHHVEVGKPPSLLMEDRAQASDRVVQAARCSESARAFKESLNETNAADVP
ncbi:hypothetical protein ACI3PL_28910, partial [Lacticaseibacillus paracasei]